MVKGVYPPYTHNSPTTKKTFFLCASSLIPKFIIKHIYSVYYLNVNLLRIEQFKY